jgi:hypothetical protein
MDITHARTRDRLKTPTFALSPFCSCLSRQLSAYPPPRSQYTIFASGPSMHSSETTPILPKHSQSSSTSPPRSFFLAYLPRVLAWCLAGFILVSWFTWVGVYRTNEPDHSRPPETQPFVLPTYISHNLGAYSPWYPVHEYASPPKGCKVTQVSRQLNSDGTLAIAVERPIPVYSLQETDPPCFYHAHTRSLSPRSIL